MASKCESRSSRKNAKNTNWWRKVGNPAKAGHRKMGTSNPGKNRDAMPDLFQITFKPAAPIETKRFIVGNTQPELVRMFSEAQERLGIRNLSVKAA